MLKEPYKRGPTTPRVVYLCPLDLGGLIGVRRPALPPDGLGDGTICVRELIGERGIELDLSGLADDLAD